MGLPGVLLYSAALWHLVYRKALSGTRQVSLDINAMCRCMCERVDALLSQPTELLLFVHGASSNHREFMIALGEPMLPDGSEQDQHLIFLTGPVKATVRVCPGITAHASRPTGSEAVAKVLLARSLAFVVGHSWGGAVTAQMAVHDGGSVVWVPSFGACNAPLAWWRFNGGGLVLRRRRSAGDWLVVHATHGDFRWLEPD